jgi:hypothetical protein
MSQSWYEDRASSSLEELTVLQQHREDAEAARRKARFEIERIKPGTRLKDRYLLLLKLMNGDPAVHDRFQLLREEIKARDTQIKEAGSRRAWLIDEIDKTIIDHLERNDPGYQGSRIEQRGLDRKMALCRALRTEISKTRKMAVGGRKLSEISAHVRAVHAKVVDLNRMPGSARSVSSDIVRKLAATDLGDESDAPGRRKQLAALIRTIDTVRIRVDAVCKDAEKRVKKLEKKRAELVKDTRDRLLSAHGLEVT